MGINTINANQEFDIQLREKLVSVKNYWSTRNKNLDWILEILEKKQCDFFQIVWTSIEKFCEDKQESQGNVLTIASKKTATLLQLVSLYKLVAYIQRLVISLFSDLKYARKKSIYAKAILEIIQPNGEINIQKLNKMSDILFSDEAIIDISAIDEEDQEIVKMSWFNTFIKLKEESCNIPNLVSQIPCKTEGEESDDTDDDDTDDDDTDDDTDDDDTDDDTDDNVDYEHQKLAEFNGYDVIKLFGAEEYFYSISRCLFDEFDSDFMRITNNLMRDMAKRMQKKDYNCDIS